MEMSAKMTVTWFKCIIIKQKKKQRAKHFNLIYLKATFHSSYVHDNKAITNTTATPTSYLHALLCVFTASVLLVVPLSVVVVPLFVVVSLSAVIIYCVVSASLVVVASSVLVVSAPSVVVASSVLV
eukprot:692956_1